MDNVNNENNQNASQNINPISPITISNNRNFQAETDIINGNEQSSNKLSKLFSVLKNFFNNFKNKVRGNWYKLPKKLRVAIVSFLVVLVIVGGAFLYRFIQGGGLKDFGRKEIDIAEFGDWKKLVIPQRQKPFFTLSASTVSKYGILPTETFILKTEKPIDINFIKENIVPSVPVTIASVNNNEFRITPQTNLDLEEVLSLKLSVEDKNYEGYSFDRDYSWAYQTQGKFRVISSIPGDKKNEVPVNSGIEIVFSQDNFNDPSPFISISPSIRYRTEVHAERFVIVPLDSLQEKTVYTVTLKKGLNLKSRNDPVTEDFSFNFQTKEKDATTHPPFFSLSEDFQQVSPAEPLITRVYTSNWNSNQIIKTEVYRFPTSQTFIASRKAIDEIQGTWMTYYSEGEKVDVSQLERIISVDLKVQSKDNINYLQLPDPLPQGFYIVQFWSEDRKRLEHVWLQSTTLTGFVSVGKEQTVVWANKLDGDPASDASVRIVGLEQGFVTYDNGTSVFNTPSILFEKTKHYVEISNTEGDVIIIPVTSLAGSAPPGKITQNDFISYLYNERYLYQPGDTVYFFGVVKSRLTNQAPANTTAILRNSSFSGTDAILTKNIVPSSDGSFLDKFKLEDIPLGWYNLVLKVGDVEVESTSFSVTQYEKPEMKIEVIANKKAMFTDEKVDFTAKISFFDGTAAKNIPMTTHESTTSNSTNLTTGDSGEVNYTYQTKYNDVPYSYYPRYETVTFTPGLAQEAKVEGFGSVYVFGSRLMINSESDQDGNKAKIKANVNNVDLSRINSGESNEHKGSPASDREVSLIVKKVWYEKKETGTYYDFIEKVTRKTYNYIRHEDKVEDKKLISDTNGEVDYEFQMEEGRSYTAELEVRDKDGHSAKTSEYYYYRTSSTYSGENRGEIPQLNLDKDESSFSLGEEVKLNILLGEKEYPDNDKNRFLFILASRGHQEVILTENPRYTFTFDVKHIPNIYIGAYIFTGKYYSQVSAPCRQGWYCSDYYYYRDKNYFNGFLISYKKEDSKLRLTIDSDKEKYAPGEDAKIIIKVEKNGTAVAGASVNLVLVDEALAALNAVRVPSILSSLYQSVDSLIYYNYSTHEPVLPDQPQAERGGGGGERDVFKDAAFFGSEVTDENGEAFFSFTLPENITSWATYAQALTATLDAGQVEGKVIVTKDFFVTSQFPKEFLHKDKPVLTGGSFGKGLSESSKVDFRAIFFEGEREISNTSKAANAFKGINFSFPDLQTGEYKVSLRGKAGVLEDGIQLPFKVMASRLNLEHFQKFNLEKGQTLTRFDAEDLLEDRQVRLVISDRGKGIYYSALNRYCYTWSNRVEKQIAKLSASKLLVERFGDNECKVNLETLKDFQYFDGGLSQVEWGGSDLSTTVWAVYVDPSPFDKERVINFLESKYNQGGGGNLQKIYSLWGLTILDKPRLTELQVLAASALSYEEKAILVLALTSAKDTEKARDLYYDLLADYAYEYPPYIRIQAELKGKSQIDSYIENTSRALLLGSLVDKTYDEGMSNYIRDFRSNTEDVVIDLASIAFIGEQLDKLPSEATKINFTSSNQNIQKELEKGKNITLTLSASELNNFNLKVLEGKAEANFNYFVGQLGLSKLPTDNLLSIKREFKKAKGEGESIKTGDIVEVRIDFNLDFEKSPTGCYTITDYLPSGLKYMSNPGAYGLAAEGWVSEKEGNVIEAFFCNSPWWQENGKKYIIYYARAASVGEYVAEPAIMQSQRYLSNFQKTSEQTIKIEGSNL